jgi:hypothetical protein
LHVPNTFLSPARPPKVSTSPKITKPAFNT